MNGIEFCRALREGRRVYATAITSPSPMLPGVIQQTGLDFVFIDTEHIALNRETVSWMCRTYAALGLPPIVRIPSPDAYEACKVLDGGALGVVAPYVETPEQVKALVGATKLRPLKGRRLHGALAGEEVLEPELRKYLQARTEGTACIVNVESIPAMENLDAILDVEEVDAILIGPHDLSCNMGIPEQYHHPKFNEAVLEIIRKARAKGRGVGVHYSWGLDLQIEWAKAGANIIIHASDIALVGQTLKRDVGELRAALGDRSTARGEDGVVI